MSAAADAEGSTTDEEHDPRFFKPEDRPPECVAIDAAAIPVINNAISQGHPIDPAQVPVMRVLREDTLKRAVKPLLAKIVNLEGEVRRLREEFNQHRASSNAAALSTDAHTRSELGLLREAIHMMPEGGGEGYRQTRKKRAQSWSSAPEPASASAGAGAGADADAGAGAGADAGAGLSRSRSRSRSRSPPTTSQGKLPDSPLNTRFDVVDISGGDASEEEDVEEAWFKETDANGRTVYHNVMTGERRLAPPRVYEQQQQTYSILKSVDRQQKKQQESPSDSKS